MFDACESGPKESGLDPVATEVNKALLNGRVAARAQRYPCGDGEGAVEGFWQLRSRCRARAAACRRRRPAAAGGVVLPKGIAFRADKEKVLAFLPAAGEEKFRFCNR